MTGPDRDEAAFYAGFEARAVTLANANRAVITTDFATVRAIVDSAPLVFAVWQDAGEPNGVGMLLVKGHALLRNIVADKQSLTVEINAVPCVCLEQAEALRRVAGESDKLN